MKREWLTAAGIFGIGLGVGQSNASPFKSTDWLEEVALQGAVHWGSSEELTLSSEEFHYSPVIKASYGRIGGQKLLQQYLGYSRAQIWYAQVDEPPGLPPGPEIGNTDGSPVLDDNIDRMLLWPPVDDQNASETLELVERAARRLNQAASACDPRVVEKFTRCVGDALARFATDLASPSVRLPPALAPVKNIVARAAREVRAATSIAAARATLQTAVAQVRVAIELVEVSNDSVAADLGTRAGNIIAASLEEVDSMLAEVEL